MMRKVQGALPVIGLISRLTTPEGGIGSDELAYPEYCRKVFEAAPEGFQIAVAELQNKYGKSAQRRFVLLCLWMVKEGCGLCSEKLIVDCARRVRVSYVYFFFFALVFYLSNSQTTSMSIMKNEKLTYYTYSNILKCIIADKTLSLRWKDSSVNTMKELASTAT